MKTRKSFLKVHASRRGGFTLIELLVVIAVIGVLAGAIIVAINPTEQLQRARDAGRKSTAQQLANAVNGYYAASGGTLPATSTTWINALTSSNDLKTQPAPASASVVGYTNCLPAANQHLGYCYDILGSNFEVYVELASKAEANKCTTNATSAFYLYSSADAKSGVVCASTAGAAGVPVGTTTVGGYTFEP